MTLVALLLLSVTLLISACGGGQTNGEGQTNGSSEATSTLDRLRDQGYVRVGFANEAPWAYATPDGQLTGVAVKTAEAILTELGVDELDGVLAEWSALVPGLQAARFDVITASMAILPDRCERVSFSNPDVKYGDTFAVAAGNPKGLNSLKDVAAQADVKFGVMAGSTLHGLAIDEGVPESRIVVAADQPAVVAMLRSGQIDAAAVNTYTFDILMTSLDHPTDIELIDQEVKVYYGAAAFRQSDDELLTAWNEQLEMLKDSGRLEEIYAEFGLSSNALPGDMTTAELCGN